MTRAEELATLRRKLAARERQPAGFESNIEAIKARIAELEAEGEDE